MLYTLSQLPPAHLAMLFLVIAAFTTFGSVLGIVYAWSNQPVRRRPHSRPVTPADARPLRTASTAG